MKFLSFSDEWEHLAGLSVAELREGAPSNRCSEVVIDQVKQQGRDILIKVRGIDDIDGTKPLVGLELWAPREYAAPRREDEYYVSDLVGLIARRDGEEVGTITAVWSTGASDYLEVRLVDSSVRHVPFLKRYVDEPCEGYVDILDDEILE